MKPINLRWINVVASVALAGCASKADLERVDKQVDELKAQVEELRDQLAERSAQHEHLRTNLVKFMELDLKGDADRDRFIESLSSRVDAIETARPVKSVGPLGSSVALPDRTYFEVGPATASVTEKNPSWWRWSYQFAARNNTTKGVKEFVKVKLLDARGFEIDSNTESVLVPPSQSRTVAGSILVDAPIAPNVKRAVAEWDR